MEATLIDKMGSDLTVINAARVSFHKESEWLNDTSHSDHCRVCDCEEMLGHEGFCYKSLSDPDQKLITYLAKHSHWTPFSHVQITLREKVPIFVARQRFKHMVGFSYNEVSRRYVDTPPEFYIPGEWRGRPINAKQGSSEEIIEWIANEEWEGYIKEDYVQVLDDIACLYKCMIESGIAPEQARMILPQSMYTEYYVTGSLAAWARAYKLRIDPHAQKEIQDLAKMWQKVIGGIEELKYSWKALKE